MNKRDVLAGGIMLLALAALLLPIASVGVDQHHDGIMLKPAFDILSGQVLFRDSFTQYGALTSYLQALALWIHPTLLSIRLLTVAAYMLTLLVLYVSWRCILPRSLAIVAGVFFILFIPAYGKDYWDHKYWMLLPWSSVYAMMFQCLGLYAFFRVIRGERPEPWAMALGVATACVFWCRQPVGVMMLGSLLVSGPALYWAGWRPVTSSWRATAGRAAGGFLLVNVLIFGGMALTGALPDWWYQNILWPARWSHSVDWMDSLPFVIHPKSAAGMLGLGLALVLPRLVGRFRAEWAARFSPAYYTGLTLVLVWQHEWLRRILTVLDGGWTLLIPLVAVLMAVGSIRRTVADRGATQPIEYYLVAVLAAVALGSLAQYYPMADGWHIFYALAPVFGLFVFALWRWSGWPAPVVAALLGLALVPEGYQKVSAIGPALNRPLVTLDKPALLRGMRVPPEQASDLGQIDDVITRILRQQPDIPAALIGDNALYLCLVHNRTNPTPYYVTWRGLATQADNLQRWEYIGRVRPLLILQSASWVAVNDFYRRSSYVPLSYVPGEALEIAVPQELADALGLKAYGAQPAAGPTPNAPVAR